MSDSEPVGENKPAEDAEHKTDTKKAEPNPNIPPTEGASSPVPAITHQYITCKPEKGWWDKIRPFVEIGGAVLLAVYTFFTIKMYCANKQSADAATSATKTAADTLTKSIEHFRIDERAWVEVERIEKTQVSTRTAQFGAGFRYRLYLKNTGKTAAHAVTVNAARNMQASINLESNADNMRRGQDSMLLNGLPKVARENPVPRVIAPGSNPAVPFVMDGQEPQFFSKDEWVSYLIGRIDYTDDFGIEHWMKFCFYVGDRAGTLWNCHEGNYEDSNPEIPPTATKTKK